MNDDKPYEKALKAYRDACRKEFWSGFYDQKTADEKLAYLKSAIEIIQSQTNDNRIQSTLCAITLIHSNNEENKPIIQYGIELAKGWTDSWAQYSFYKDALRNAPEDYKRELWDIALDSVKTWEAEGWQHHFYTHEINGCPDDYKEKVLKEAKTFIENSNNLRYKTEFLILFSFWQDDYAIQGLENSIAVLPVEDTLVAVAPPGTISSVYPNVMLFNQQSGFSWKDVLSVGWEKAKTAEEAYAYISTWKHADPNQHENIANACRNIAALYPEFANVANDAAEIFENGGQSNKANDNPALGITSFDSLKDIDFIVK